MKDFFDVYQIMTRQEINSETLEEAIKATFTNRRTRYTENHPLFTKDFYTDTNRNLYWKAFLRKIKYDDALPFTTIGTFMMTIMQPYWIKLSL